MQSESLIGAAWPTLLSRLPASLDLEATARACGALLRRRGVPDAETLLRLALSYGACGQSLRGTAAWAETASVASLSDVAVLNRLRGSAPWLAMIAAAILSVRVRGPAFAGSGPRLRLIDATSLSAPGSRGVDWRVHLAYDLDAQQISEIELSDGSGAESLGRFDWQPGEVALGDRGYAKAGDLAAVRQAGADFIVRIGWNALRLRARDGARFDLFAALDRLPQTGVAEVSVALDRAGKTLLPARLIVARKPEDEAARSRREARRKSRRQGKTLKPETLRAAGYVFVLTSLDGARATAADILALYRLRWQIELAFKRLKSLLDLGALPAKDPDLARCWIYAKLIVALLLEDVTRRALDSPPWADPRQTAIANLAVAPAARAA